MAPALPRSRSVRSAPGARNGVPARAARAVGTTLAVLALAGCGLVPGNRGEADWQHDEGSDRFYVPDATSSSTELVDEHFPDLAPIAAATVTDGRFTDPGDRMPIPGVDDYWWQAVIELEPDGTDDLVEAAAASADDGVGPTVTEDEAGIDDADVLAQIVPPLEDKIAPCPGGWVPTTRVHTEPGYENRSAGGDGIELAALCPDTDQLVVSLFDM